MKSNRYFRRFVVALLTLALLTACTPSARQPGAGTGDYTQILLISAAVSIGSLIVTYLVRYVLDRALPASSGIEEYHFGDDFALDLTGGRFEVALSGAAPPGGTYRGEPLGQGRHPDDANLAFAVRGHDADGSGMLIVTVLHQEASDDAFTLVLVDSEPSQTDSGGRVARLVLGDGEDDAYQGSFSWSLTADTSTRVSGSFEALGLVSAAGVGPLDVIGDFDVGVNPVGSMAIVRR